VAAINFLLSHSFLLPCQIFNPKSLVFKPFINSQHFELLINLSDQHLLQEFLSLLLEFLYLNFTKLLEEVIFALIQPLFPFVFKVMASLNLLKFVIIFVLGLLK